MGIVLALLLFGCIVMFHELGHFLLAKKNGIRVSEFAVGMGPTLFHTEKNGTTYSLKLLPIGGFCAMGEDDPDDMSEGSFNSKSVWARISVIAAGPLFNFMMAFILAVILVGRTGYDPTVISDVSDGLPAQEQGMQAGDKIVKLGNRRVHLYREITMYLQMHTGETIEVTYERDGNRHTVVLTPQYVEDEGRYMIGIVRAGGYEKGGLLTTLEYGVYEVRYWIYNVLDSLKMLITGAIGVDNLSGPVGVVNFVDDSYQKTVEYGASAVIGTMMNIAILLSANLGVMNLLPLPALDGGRLVFLILEAIRGKRVPPEKEGLVHFAGFVALMVLMVFVMFNDLRQIF
ncbi:MAG TPA: RIP metalloprotease RseP [Lachnospiraceae bacterium]|nr:RIP metalloprotease RseP [Lachnospiraceae bacterium]